MAQNLQNSRFKDAAWFPQEEGVTTLVGGAGGIGSWLAFFLSRIGYKVNIYDFDLVEDHNLGGQLFTEKDLGRSKVSAVSNMVYSFSTNRDIRTHAEPVTINTPTHWFCFSAFDNMEARNALFEVWKKSWEIVPEGVTPLFIDGRLELEQLQVFCVTPENANKYKTEHLFDDSVVEEAPCTMKQTSHTAAMIGSIMTAFFTNHIANTYAEETIREVPFYYEFVVPMNYTYSEI